MPFPIKVQGCVVKAFHAAGYLGWPFPCMGKCRSFSGGSQVETQVYYLLGCETCERVME